MARKLLHPTTLLSPVLLLALLTALPCISQAQALGRLFYSPGDRVKLDNVRKSGVEDVPQKSDQPVSLEEAEAATEKAAPPPPVDQVTLDGFVKRSSGKNTAWLNQLPHHGNDNPQGILVLTKSGKSAAVSVRLPSGKYVALKPGQTFDAVSGKIRDAYQDGAAKE